MPKAKKSPIKKKSSAGKGTPGSRAKKSPKTKKPVAAGTSSAGINRTPLYVLAILILLTVILVMANGYFGREHGGQGKTAVTPGTGERNGHEEKDKRGVSKKAINTAEDGEKIADRDARADKKGKDDSLHEKDVKVYFIQFNEKTEKTALLPVTRKIRSDSPLKDTLTELIKGPNKKEERRGLLTAVPSHLRIRGMEIRNRTAVIDFNGAIEENANGSILLSRIDQILYTATQFENVDSIMIKVNGRSKKFLGSDGLSLGGPLHRKGR